MVLINAVTGESLASAAWSEACAATVEASSTFAQREPVAMPPSTLEVCQREVAIVPFQPQSSKSKGKVHDFSHVMTSDATTCAVVVATTSEAALLAHVDCDSVVADLVARLEALVGSPKDKAAAAMSDAADGAASGGSTPAAGATVVATGGAGGAGGGAGAADAGAGDVGASTEVATKSTQSCPVDLYGCVIGCFATGQQACLHCRWWCTQVHCWEL